MCNILFLKPGVMPDEDKFITMVQNNWHSYGLVTKIPDMPKLDIKRSVPKTGEIDPEEIWKLLERDIEFERLLHVRHNTAGATDLKNCHPFDIFYSDKRHVTFAHNGTLHMYKSKKQVENQWKTGFTTVDDDDGPSDTRNFCEQILAPAMAELHGKYSSPITVKILNQFWSANNRGIVFSNDQGYLLLGEWKTLKNQKGEEFLSSNDDYFTALKRGPAFERQEAREKEVKRLADEAKKARTFQAPVNQTSTTSSYSTHSNHGAQSGGHNQTSKTNTNVIPLKEFKFGRQASYDFTLSESLHNILSDYTFWNRDAAVNLGYATLDEIDKLANSPKDAKYVMDWVFGDYAKMYEELDDVEAKHDLATQHITKIYAATKHFGVDIDDLILQFEDKFPKTQKVSLQKEVPFNDDIPFKPGEPVLEAPEEKEKAVG